MGPGGPRTSEDLLMFNVTLSDIFGVVTLTLLGSPKTEELRDFILCEGYLTKYKTIDLITKYNRFKNKEQKKTNKTLFSFSFWYLKILQYFKNSF